MRKLLLITSLLISSASYASTNYILQKSSDSGALSASDFYGEHCDIYENRVEIKKFSGTLSTTVVKPISIKGNIKDLIIEAQKRELERSSVVVSHAKSTYYRVRNGDKYFEIKTTGANDAINRSGAASELINFLDLVCK